MEQKTMDLIDSTLNSIKGELVRMDSDEISTLYIDWIKSLLYDTINNSKENDINQEIKILRKQTPIDEKKIKYLKKKKKKIEHQNYNHNLQIGDIVHVNYGYGYCGELSIGHYGVILSEIKNNMYFVVPLSSDPLNMFSIYFENLNLPSSDGCDSKKSYIRFEQVGFIHYRRIENITVNNQTLYRKLTPTQLIYLNEKFLEFIKFKVDKYNV